MKPILFSIGPFNVYSFGFLLAVAFIFSTFIIWKFGREELKEEEYLDMYFATSFVALLSARAIYILLNFQDFGTNILRYILVRDTPGLSLIGGLFGGFLFLYWYAKKKRYNVLHLFDLFAVSSSLALVFTKIGQFLGGSGFGTETVLPLGVRIVGITGIRHPVELYEAFSLLILSCALYVLYTKSLRRKWPKGLTSAVFVWGVSLTIFLLEFFKVRTLYLYAMSFRQVVAAIGLIVFLIPIIQRVQYLRKKDI
ncbi:prolipoprotein diacylglyceryl transferase [Candidatus Gottesmanbacteria bacterium]|nr:prolipoprotein diacylglyceryl transferase [Candidatus Gottesmanbacteria bacterium]